MASFSWTMSTARAYTIAGANATIDELLQGINDLVVAEATLWEVSELDIAAHTLELKRKASGSPTGEYATVRILFFGSSSPNSAAIIPVGTAAAANNLYCCLSVDANTTGPGTAFTAGAPYATKFLQGDLVCTNASFAAASNPRITFMESTEGIAFCFNLLNSTNIATTISGKLLTRASDGTHLWCNITSGGTWTSSAAPSSILAPAVPFGIPCYQDTSSASPKPSYYNGTSVRQFGSLLAHGGVNTVVGFAHGLTGAVCLLHPIVVAESSQANTQTEEFFGSLRQIRLGPVAVHRARLENASAVTVAKHFHGSATSGVGIWFDEVE